MLRNLVVNWFVQTENVTWFEFDETGHQMHHQGGERVNEPVALGDFLKTPQYEVGNDDGKSTSSRGSKNNKVLQEKYERAFRPSPKVGSSTVPEGSWSHESRKVVPAICNPNSFRDFTSLASQDDAGLVYVENQYMDRENDILYHDLPDTGSFEDIDRMLRICESTFGQGSSSADELSWFSSSSQSTYGIGDTFKSYSQSSILDPTALNGTLAHHSAITNVFPENNPFADDSDKILGHCYRSFVPVSSGENKSDCTPQEKAYDGDGSTEIKSTLIQVGDENSLNEFSSFEFLQINMHLKKLRRPYLFEGNEKDQLSESTSNMSFCGPGQMQQIADQDNVSSVFSAQPYSSQLFPKQNHVWGSSSSSNMHTFSLRAQLEGSLPLHQDLFAQKTLSILSASDYNPSSSYEVSAHASNYFPQCMENLPVPLSEPPAMMPEEINEKPCLEQILCGASSAKHPSHLSSSTSITSRQEQHHTFQHEIRGDSVQKDVSFKLPAIETDSSTIQESPCMTSGFSDDISLKAISFQQLQDVMLQLDSGTRLCIRDSLYRLAQSAERRHNFISANNSSKERGGGILDTEESNRSAGYITTETETNSIDRSIAHLLFHRPSETVTRSSECATSLESHMIDEQIHGHVQLPGSNS
ncbi:protein LNK1-like isoform X2 [Phoenix dactylifera]|uniref:Protein LNK1-like isoform X2 n=1 Tax=Phoenix dactylifera TaxID=42345 RepID=A0A8B8ZN71_PHODC|nr:protein LNK1-like isoform X2 [Phoenix dactylifera]